MILALVITACILFLLAAIFSRASIPQVLLSAGLFCWALSTIWGKF